MTTLTVGSDKQFQTVSAAIAASGDGDTVLVDAGTYTNDFSAITTDITLTAVGGMVSMVATVPPPDEKAIFTIDGNVTINGFEFSGAHVADQNGAGIRFQSGNLVINDCYFHDNETGILTGNDGVSTITIDDSEFGFNGTVSGQAHNLYVGQIASATITDSYFHDASVGHEIKSRAQTTVITNNRIQDQNGTSSFTVDIPNGGNATITGNVIEQGPNSENSHIMSYGAGGVIYASNSLVIDNNVILNDKVTSLPFLTNTSGVVPQFSNNDVWGLTLAQLPASQTNTTFLTVEPPLDTSHPFDAGSTPPPPPPPPSPTDLILTGGPGKNTLVGGDGNDILNGRRGKDTLITGDGHDTIVFDTPLGKNNVDTCFDFSTLNDTIQLGSNIFASTSGITYDFATGGLSYNDTLFVVLSPGLVLDDINFKIV